MMEKLQLFNPRCIWTLDLVFCEKMMEDNSHELLLQGEQYLYN